VNENPWVIDGDGHVYEPYEMFDRYLPAEFVAYGRELHRRFDTDDAFGLRRHAAEYRYLQPANERIQGGLDPAARLRDMDADLIERAFIYPTLGLIIQGVTERRPAIALARAVNDWMADYCRHAPQRLIGIGVLPVVDAGAALDEAKRCIDELGFGGVYRRPEAYDVPAVHDPSFEPLWEYLEARDVPIGIHSGYSSLVPQPFFNTRFEGNYLAGHAASFVTEAMNALTSFVFYGILERHPRLRVGLVECGAVWAMGYCHRLDEHMKSWPTTHATLTMKPSEYFRRQVFVSVEEYEPGLAAMLDLYPHNVVFESDYPHPDGTFPGATADLLECGELSEHQKRAVLRDNSLRLYGLDQVNRAATSSR
jgi:predicted TIM-barrel fold metal-dependent hydrolase